MPHHEGDLDLEPIGIQYPWHGAVEVPTRATCGVCGAVVMETMICLACLRAAAWAERHLAVAVAEANRKAAKKPPAKFQPKAKDAGLFSAKERRWALRQARRSPEGRRWAGQVGLAP